MQTTNNNLTNHTYNVEWWMYSGRQDDYVDYDEKVVASSEEEAIQTIKNKYPRAKSLKACKIPRPTGNK